MKKSTEERKIAEYRPTQQAGQAFVDELAKLLDPLGDDGQALLELFRSAISLETLKEGYCPKCSKMVYIRYPDYSGASKLINQLLDRVLGKPVQRVEEKHEHTGRIQLQALQNASLEELKQLAAGD